MQATTQAQLSTANTQQIRVRGQVQGVGFRPTVYRIAQQLEICGSVYNDGDGVLITAQADEVTIQQFIDLIWQNKPPLAQIDSIDCFPETNETLFGDFTIQQSPTGEINTGVVADAATCKQCLDDINDPNNRRFGYAFTNCTHCGPRLSIVRNIPYDRPFTSMDEFEQCPACLQEYQNPLDRRFHAQPNACPDCGPVLQLCDYQGNPELVQDIIAHTAELLKQGRIIAIKGIGGFQLACDATNDNAVQELRQRKHRPFKALALMAVDVDQIKHYCSVSELEQQQLASPAAPILVLQQLSNASTLSDRLAPGQQSLGFMLPYSPLHHLLMQQLDAPIVLTSGNASHEPQCIDNDQALEKLGDIADYFLLHNRAIVNRIDDSVLRIIDGQTQYYRRARGFAPAPIALPDDFNNQNQILALGAELKNTFALLRGQQLTLSQHMGDLENYQTYEDTLKNLDLYQRLFDFKPDALVIDKHPEYLSSKLGRQWAHENNLPLIEVQHHHAHIAACMADNHWRIDQGQVIGVALDGLGLGDDDTLWGGEFMLADYYDYQRLGSLMPVALPGGVKAMLEPWRNTFAQLNQTGSWLDLNQQFGKLDLFQYLNQKPVKTLQRMIQTNTNAPLSSSCGRLFDAVAAAVGLCADEISYEGQAAIELEALIQPQQLQQAQAYPFDIIKDSGPVARINTVPMWHALLNDLVQGIEPAMISARFHHTLARMILDMVSFIAKQHGINTVALSGGVMQNPTLFTLTRNLLTGQGLQVLTHRQIPANDGGLAIGQAAIAAACLQLETN
jgi:hydrogenase maturation protein HypF